MKKFSRYENAQTIILSEKKVKDYSAPVTLGLKSSRSSGTCLTKSAAPTYRNSSLLIFRSIRRLESSSIIIAPTVATPRLSHAQTFLRLNEKTFTLLALEVVHGLRV